MLTISELFIYPLKSARGIAVESMTLNRRGPKYDRQWMAVRPNGKFLTQRQFPKLCLIDTQMDDTTLMLSAPDAQTISVGATERELPVIIWRDHVIAKDCGDETASWISDYLGTEARLVEMPSSYRRLVNPEFASHGETVGFADGFPLLIVSRASLQQFNRWLQTPVGFERFRPNIVVDGCDPFAEDSWKEMVIGDFRLSIVKPCSRCIIPSIDQESGQKHMEVNEALLTHRRRNGKTCFGQNALHHGTGRLNVGDPISLT